MGSRRERREKRHRRIKKKVQGSIERPRLAVYRSLTHIYAQLVDDASGRTVASASTLDKELGARLNGMPRVEASREVGKLVAERAVANGYKRAVFDRGGCPFHGRVKALAEGAREAGLEF